MASTADLAIMITAKDQASSVLAGVNKEVGGFGSAVASVAGTAMTALAAAAVGVGAGLAASVSSAMDFEKQMSAISAVSGASAGEMAALQQAALDLGAKTSFSAKEAAAGIEELVKAGVSIEDVLGGAAAAALDLAAAGGIEVAEAAEIASNAMNVFNIEGEKMGHVADVIAGAANASAIGVNDYKFSLSAAGAVAATVGISFESLSEAIAVMGNAGIKGSDAGTSLKTMLMNLVPSSNKQIDLFRDLGITTMNTQKAMEAFTKLGLDPANASMEDAEDVLKKAVTGWDGVKKMTTDQEKAWVKAAEKLGIYNNAFFDAEGKAKSFADISQVLQDALRGMTKEQQIATLETMFGSDAIRAAAVMAEAGAEGFAEMAAAMSKVTAQSVAAERLNNLSGSLEQLKGSLETLAITFGLALLPSLKLGVDGLTEFVNMLIPLAAEYGPMVAAAIASLGETLAAVFGQIRAALPEIIALVQAFFALFTGGDSMAAVSEMLESVFGPAATALILDFVRLAGDAWRGLSASFMDLVGGIVAWFQQNWPLIAQVGAQVLTNLVRLWETHGANLVTIVQSAWRIITNVIGGALDIVGSLVRAFMQLLTGDLSGAMETLAELFARTWERVKEIFQANLDGIVAILDIATGGMLGTVTQWVADTATAVMDGMAAVTESVTSGWASVQEAVGSILPTIQATIMAVWNLIPEDIRADLVLITNHLITAGAE
jgi:hypothetical protein